ncbi:hypothetical protein E5676_scaffold124G00960 [Cucumis melo var. makuwa]|uniref:Uncharacterized protein n=1 Tax=Cucumis melo var. makuwa TaxID=1194695 RepID=A0A5D3DTC0_CUCMM|nr:hypothetical protein E5676_scaffold124G00960 [Cucumis melo var. makuwa]
MTRLQYERCRSVIVVDGLVWTEGLICASFGITRLIGVSFGVTRLIRASFGITRLICKGTTRGRPTRGKKDASARSSRLKEEGVRLGQLGKKKAWARLLARVHVKGRRLKAASLMLLAMVVE